MCGGNGNGQARGERLEKWPTMATLGSMFQICGMSLGMTGPLVSQWLSAGDCFGHAHTPGFCRLLVARHIAVPLPVAFRLYRHQMEPIRLVVPSASKRLVPCLVTLLYVWLPPSPLRNSSPLYSGHLCLCLRAVIIHTYQMRSSRLYRWLDFRVSLLLLLRSS